METACIECFELNVSKEKEKRNEIKIGSNKKEIWHNLVCSVLSLNI